MKKMLFIATCLAPLSAVANPDVTSREYKLMLDPSHFIYNDESTNVSSLLSAVETSIENTIMRNVTGSPYLAKIRDVKFYDTANSCELMGMGYSFRERIENNNSEVTLKFRDADRYIADFEDLSAISSSAETKLESDIGYTSTVPFKVVYSHSTKVPNTRNINEMKDINVQFPGFETNYGYTDSTALSLVGNLTIREHVYKGLTIDLGQFDAEISVTLWYNGIPSGTQSPVVAEISYKYLDASADYTKAVVNRAKTAFLALQGLTAWVDSNSKTKTQFVYDYNPNFCN